MVKLSIVSSKTVKFAVDKIFIKAIFEVAIFIFLYQSVYIYKLNMFKYGELIIFKNII